MNKVVLLLMTLSALGATSSQAGELPLDILGIKVGMPAQEAVNRLRQIDPKASYTVNQVKFKAIPGKAVPAFLFMQGAANDSINLEFSLPPEPAVVVSISRTTHLPLGKHPARAKVLESLKKKYGDSPLSKGNMFPHLLWHENPEMRRNAEGNPSFMGCAVAVGLQQVDDVDAEIVRQAAESNANNITIMRECGKYVQAEIQASPEHDDLVASLSVRVADPELRVARYKKTAEWLAQVEAQNAKKKLDGGKGEKAPEL